MMGAVRPFYLFASISAIALALLFPVTRHIRSRALKWEYYRIQGLTILGAITGAKISVLVGDLHWPWVAMPDWTLLVTSGRSITGALIGGFLTAEVAKPLLGYSMPPNDRFAAILPFSIAVGRVGCALSGCCAGIPYDGFCAVRDSAGLPRFPSQWYEALFHTAAGLVFLVMVKRGWFFGRIFSLYLVVYGVFRFFSEITRETPKNFGGYSAYQGFALLMILLGIGFLIKRTWWPPAIWNREEEIPVMKGACA
jgi:phosphatidylglycerol:prolipoprotein diacylglycerol transferase